MRGRGCLGYGMVSRPYHNPNVNNYKAIELASIEQIKTLLYLVIVKKTLDENNRIKTIDMNFIE